MSKNSLIFGLLILALLASPAQAQNCATFPNTLTNGTTADATKVMGNFTYLGGCTASIANPAFTGLVGIGGTSSSYPLTVFAPSTNTSGTFAGINVQGAQSVADTGNVFGIYATPTYSAASGTLNMFNGARFMPQNTSGGTITNFAGVFEYPENTGNGSITSFYGNWTAPQNTGSGTVTSMTGVYAAPANTSSGTVTTMTGVQSTPVETSTATGAITNMYGVSSTPTVQGAPTTSINAMYGYYANCYNTNASATVSNCYLLFLGTPTVTGTISHTYGVYQNYSSAVNYLAGEVGIGTSTPHQALEVNGEVQIDTLAAATSTNVCINANVLASCSSSLRYKENVKDAPFGLDEVMKMRPVTFKWKGRDEEDFGLIAEEVAKIDPLFATYRDGKIEGVKYGQLTAVLVGAVKQLKTANDAQAQEIVRLRNEVDQLQKEQETQSADRQELSTLKSENALLKARLDGIDARLDGLETRRHMHSASRSERMLHLASSRGG